MPNNLNIYTLDYSLLSDNSYITVDTVESIFNNLKMDDNVTINRNTPIQVDTDLDDDNFLTNIISYARKLDYYLFELNRI